MSCNNKNFNQPGSKSGIEQLSVNTIRCLSMDIVQKASSGHPGLPMGASDFAYVLWMKHLKHYPGDPEWANRDRFILSPGHGAALLYSLLYLFGYGLTMEEIRDFRQWESRLAGHPEYGLTPGVETSTGPLGQGFANGAGMALAEKMLAVRFNSPGNKIVDHHTYALVSDGDTMEGITHEAASLAAHWGLGKLIYFYDFNRITIEGSTALAFSEDVKKRYEAYGWHVLEVDGHDRAEIDAALSESKAEESRPSLIIGHTMIGKGSPNKENTPSAHGEPLGEEEVQATKKNLCYPCSEPFFVPDEVMSHIKSRTEELKEAYSAWTGAFEKWSSEEPEKRKMWDDAHNRSIPGDLKNSMPEFEVGKEIATRSASGEAMQAIAKAVPYFIGGAADLAPSTKTLIKESSSVSRDDFSGQNIHFGVREHGMGGIINGISLHGGFIPFGSTFFVFFDYMRPSVRLAALMKRPVVYVFTHDSIFVGEDGPSHQPIEQMASLRAIPRIVDIRPCDAAETAAAWQVALDTKDAPVALILTRQNLPVLDRSGLAPADGIRKGAYVIADSGGEPPEIIIIASGSEVHPALGAFKELSGSGIKARVVNLASWKLFSMQDEEYREMVLPEGVKNRVGVEAGSSFGWEKFIGSEGAMISMDDFGVSAPYKVLAEQFGFTAENIAKRAREVLGR